MQKSWICKPKAWEGREREDGKQGAPAVGAVSEVQPGPLPHAHGSVCSLGRSTWWLQARRDTFRAVAAAEGREGKDIQEESWRRRLSGDPGKECDQTEMSQHADPRHTCDTMAEWLQTRFSGSDDLILVLLWAAL